MVLLDLMQLSQSGRQSSWKPADAYCTKVQEGSEVLAAQNILCFSPTENRILCPFDF